MKTKFFLIAGLLAAGLTACSEMDEFADNNSYVDDGKSIKIEVTDEFAHAATRANYSGFPATTFEEGDQIGIYAVNTSNAAVASNVAFTRQSDGSWTPASSVAYNPDYKYYAYFPYKSSVPSFTPAGSGADGKFTNFLNNNTFWLANQSTKANFTTSNLMWAEGVTTGERTVKFTMQHKRGLAIIGNSPNKWYYTDATGTKYNLTQEFTGNIPYEDNGTRYFLMKPNTVTSVGGLSLRAGAGKYMTSVGGEITGTVSSWSYRTSNNLGSSWGSWKTSKPSWLTITTQTEDGEPTEFLVTTTNSTSTTIKLGNDNVRNLPANAILKAATPVSNVDLSMVDNAGTARASRTTANCYLVHAPGTYKIPLVYGNAIKNGDETSTSAFYTTETTNTLQRLVNHADEGITTPWIKTQLGACPDGAQLIWEDVKEMISSVGIDTSGNGFLTFTVDADNIGEGNAVIAATLDGTIVWSWHIWVTTETLSNLTTISTGSHDYQVAPVNLGQVNGNIIESANIYAGDLCQVKATANGITVEFEVAAKDYAMGGTVRYNPSTYYQWGRKDPFYPAGGGYNSEGTLVSSYNNNTITEETTTPGETIQHPDYIVNANYGVYPDGAYRGKTNYWDMNQTVFGNNLANATVKTVYDPCPPGFCVPTNNLFYYAKSNSGQTAWQTSPPGRNWTVNDTQIFFPACGSRDINNYGRVNVYGNYGYYWSAIAANSQSYAYRFEFSQSAINFYNIDRKYCYSIRPVAEE